MKGSLYTNFIKTLKLILPLFKNNSPGLGGKPAPVTYLGLNSLLRKLGLQNVEKFSAKEWPFEECGGVQEETVIGRFVCRRWEWTLSLNKLMTDELDDFNLT